jgi:hypothetical protein
VTAVREASATDAGAAPGDGRGRAAAWRVTLAIARIEAARLIRHPATVIGLTMSSGIAILVLVSIVPVVQREAAELAAIALPAAGGVLLAGHLAASRLERDDVLPLASVAPSTAATRTAGLLVALLGPATVAALWTSAVLLLMPLTGGAHTGTIDGIPALGDVLAPSATVLLFGALGVALGRWLPATLAGFFVLPLLAAGLLMVYDVVKGFAVSRLLPVADWVDPNDMIQMRPRAPWAHLLYVLLLTAVVAGIALCRDRATAPVVAGTIACVAATAAVAVQLITVWDDEALVTMLVRDIRDPGRRLTCDAHRQVPVCVPAGFEAWRVRLRDPAVDALTQVPMSARRGPLQVQLRPQPWKLASSAFAEPPGAADRLPPDIGAALPRDVREALVPWPYASRPPRLVRLAAPRTVPALFLQYRGAEGDAQRLDLALGVLAEVTGFRDTVRERERQIRTLWGYADGDPDAVPPGPSAGCRPRLEAREVLTFALAALSDPAARAALERELTARPYAWADEHGFDDWFLLPGGAVTGTAATDDGSGDDTGPWSRGAATLGLALADRVDATDLHAEWDRWTDHATGADELIEEFGIPPLPSPAELADEAGVDNAQLACR